MWLLNRLILFSLFFICILAQNTYAISITAKFLDTSLDATTISGNKTNEILDPANNPSLANRRNSPTAKIMITNNTDGSTEIVTGEPHVTGSGRATSVKFSPISFDSSCTANCVIGSLDIFNGITNADTAANSFILELTTPQKVSKWWFFIDNTSNNPGNVPDAFTFAAADDFSGKPIAQISDFFVKEEEERLGLPVEANVASSGQLAPTGIIPEPNTFVLIGTGLLGLFIWRCKNPRSRHVKQPVGI